MTIFKTLLSRLRAAAVLLAGGLALSACSNLEINAPILEYAGINLNTKEFVEKKVDKNPPLVVPPKMAALPEPGARAKAAAGQDQNWPLDPDEMKKQAEYAKCIKALKYRKDGNWDLKKGDLEDFEKNQDPLARNPGLFHGYKKGDKADPCAKFKNASTR